MSRTAAQDNLLRVFLTNITNLGLHVRHPTLLFVLKGCVIITADEASAELRESDVALLHPGDRCGAPEGRANLVLVYEIDQDALDELLDGAQHMRCNSVLDPNPALARLRAVLANCAKHFFDPSDEGRLLYRADAYQLLHLLSSAFRAPGEDDGAPGDPYGERIRAIRRYIRQNHRSQLTIQDLADHLFLTPQYLSRFMKARMGINFIDYLNATRLKGAVRELLETSSAITQVAYNNGFPNMAAFNREFKREYGETPRSHRERHRGKPAGKEAAAVQLDFALAGPALSSYVEHADEETDDRTAQQIRVPVQSAPRSPLDAAWLRVINLGFAADIMSFDFQQQLTAVQHRLRFRYARVEGIFDVGIIDRIPNTSAYNYSSANKILDFLTSIQLTPFLELSPKPRKINIVPHDYVRLVQDSPALTDEQYLSQIKGFMNNCINRYGQGEVEKWQFECWAPHNEHVEYAPKELARYVRRFADVFRLIKSLLPGARIGGPGFNLSGNAAELDVILDGWRRTRIQPDFVSVYSFHMESPRGDTRNGAYFTTNTEFLRQRTDEVRAMMSVRGLQAPLYVTQWNFDFTSRNFLNDSLFKAAFVVKNMIDNARALPAMGYWLLSDLTASYKDTHRILFGGNGLVSIDGLPKPAFYALESLSRLGRYMIAQGENHIVTTSGIGDYQVLLHHYCHPLDFYCLKCDTEITKENVNDIFAPTAPKKIAVHLEGVPPGAYRVKQFITNQMHGSVLDQWNQMQGVDELSAPEIAHLQQMSVPDMKIGMQQSDGTLTLEASLEPNEIRIFSIHPIR